MGFATFVLFNHTMKSKKMKNFTAQILINGEMVATPIKAKDLESAREIARNIQFEVAYAADVNNTNYQPEVTEV